MDDRDQSQPDPAGPLATVAEPVSLTRVVDETVLLDSDSGVYYGLNASGADMLDLALAKNSLTEAVAALGELYEADASDLRADLLELLARLSAAGLIDVRADLARDIEPAAGRQAPPE
ncbi:MAG: PqqD family protein [Anaerolineae bacterium]